MKKLKYLFWAIVCFYAAAVGLAGDDIGGIGTRIILFIVFLIAFIYFVEKFKETPLDDPESSQEASSDAPAAGTPTITQAKHKRGSDGDYTSIDIETTGLGDDARIIELGAVRMRKGRKVAEYSQLVNPGMPIPAKVTQITGIADRDVRRQPTIDKALPRFFAFCGKDTLIGHNIERFDLPVIAREGARARISMPHVDYIDTLPLSQSLLPQLDRHRVVDLIRYFGIAKTERHRAADDAEQTAQIFECLKRL